MIDPEIRGSHVALSGRDRLPAGRAEERAGRLPVGHVGDRSRSAWRAPVRLDHAPHGEDEDELRGARGAAVSTSNPSGAGRYGAQCDNGTVAAGRTHPIARFWHEGRRRRIREYDAASGALRVPPPPDRRARRIGRHGDAVLGGRAGGAVGDHPGRVPGALNAERAGRRTLGARPGISRSTSQTWKQAT